MLSKNPNFINEASKTSVMIRDIIGVGKKSATMNSYPAGEFAQVEPYGGKQPDALESFKHTVDRLQNTIENMLNTVSAQHRAANCEPETNVLLPDKRNCITRFITNEFFFYTKTPLQLDQFQDLMQQIMNWAKKQSGNIHLILGSFAVLAPDGRVMNVTPFIESGALVRINLIVKNNVSHLDPRYDNHQNVDFKFYEGDTSVEWTKRKKIYNFSITIDGRMVPFSFNTIFQCKTSGNQWFYCCVDVCLDHNRGVSKGNFLGKMDFDIRNIENQAIPTQCSHVVLSNHTRLSPGNAMGIITHVDPNHSHTSCKKRIRQHGIKVRKVDETNLQFGTPVNLYIVESFPCDPLVEQFLDKANFYNLRAQLRQAILSRNLEMIKSLATGINDLNFRFSDGFTPIDVAAQQGDLQIMEFFLRNGADPDGQFDGTGMTLLGISIYSKVLPTVNLLLNNGASYDLPVSVNGLPPSAYHEQVFGEKLKVTDAEKRRNICMALRNAIATDNLQKVNVVLGRHEAGSIDLNQMYLDWNGCSLLELAVQRNNVAITKALIAKGALPNIHSSDGRPLIFHAISNRNKAMQNAFIESGVDVNASIKKPENHANADAVFTSGQDYPSALKYAEKIETFYKELEQAVNAGDIDALNKPLMDSPPVFKEQFDPGSLLLFTAVQMGHVSIAKRLIECGSNPCCRNEWGYVPLYSAVFHQNQAMIDVLQEGGADMRVPLWINGPQALQYSRDRSVAQKIADEELKLMQHHYELRTAVEEGNAEKTKQLLNTRGNINDRYHDGYTLLELAARYGNCEIAKLIIEHGADVNLKGVMTPLQAAVNLNNMSMYQVLIKERANPNTLGTSTPLEEAISFENAQMIQALLKNGARKDLSMKNGMLPIDFYKSVINQRKVNAPSSFMSNSLFNADNSAVSALDERKLIESLMPVMLQVNFLRSVLNGDENQTMTLIKRYPELLDMKPSSEVIAVDNKFKMPGTGIDGSLTYTEIMAKVSGTAAKFN